MNEILHPIFLYAVIMLSVIIHEYSHAFIANELGDPTAKIAGRLTLNPIAHIDLVGTILVPIILMMTAGFFIGWAKPVPFDPRNIRDPKGELKIAFGGPGSNLIIAGLISVGFLGLRLIFPAISENEALISAVSLIIFVNIFLALFNLIPVPPLDGSKVFGYFLSPNAREAFFSIGPMGILIALFVSAMILSPVAQLVFNLFTGFGYVFG